MQYISTLQAPRAKTIVTAGETGLFCHKVTAPVGIFQNRKDDIGDV